jgi:peptidase inhibitor family I36
MRTHVFAATAAVAMLATLGVAKAARVEQDRSTTESCVGLNCAEPGSNSYVPEARRPVTSVSGPRQLAQQTTAAFYDYGLGTMIGNRAVAFVVPHGQFDRMPASVRALPLVRQIEAETDFFKTSTVVVFGPHVFEWTPVESRATAARKQRVKRNRRIRARAAVGNPPCPDNTFCLYDQDNLEPGGAAWGSNYTGAGWQALSNFGWNDRANSVANRRDRDSLLNKNYPATGGSNDGYCSDSHSSDWDLTNNFGGPAFPGGGWRRQ